MISLSFPSTPANRRRARLLDGVIYLTGVFGFTWYVVTIMRGQFLADLAAVYYAGRFFADGAYDLIHWTAVPPEWTAALRADGYDGTPHAFTFPPIWAALASPLTSWLSPQSFFLVFTVLHMFLFCAAIRMTRDIFDHDVPLVVWAFPVMAVLPASMFGVALIGLGSPTAFLSFMIVLGFRALVDGEAKRAAVWLALAAAFKVFPVVLGVIFLTRRFRQGLVPFIATGLIVMLLSFAVVPISLHRAFVEIGLQASASILLAYSNLSLEGFLAWLQALATGHAHDGTKLVPAQEWIDTLTLLAAVIFVVWLNHAARLSSPQELRQRVFPVAVLGVTLIAPVTGIHHFAISLAFLPGLFLVWLPRIAAPITALVVLGNLPTTYRALEVPWYPMLGFASMVCLMLAFLVARNDETRPV